MATWGLAKAKAQLSEVIHEAITTGPQTLSRSGREVAVVVSIAEWKAVQGARENPQPAPESFHDFIINSPLHGVKLAKLPKWKPGKLEL